jgi:hypothetical protein
MFTTVAPIGAVYSGGHEICASPKVPIGLSLDELRPTLSTETGLGTLGISRSLLGFLGLSLGDDRPGGQRLSEFLLLKIDLEDPAHGEFVNLLCNFGKHLALLTQSLSYISFKQLRII